MAAILTAYGLTGWFAIPAEPIQNDAAVSASEDQACINRVLGSDPDAFREIIERYRLRVIRLAFRFTSNPADQDDLAQEIFVDAFRKLKSYRAEAPFEHWLMRVATNRCRSWLRSRKRKPLGESLELSEATLPSTNPTTASEARELLEAAFAGMHSDDRLVLTLLDLEGFSVREVCTFTKWSESKVKTRAMRARRTLAARLKHLDAHET